MSRRLLLLSLPWHRRRDPRVPLGHGSLLASLRGAGIEVEARSFSLNCERFDRRAVLEFVLSRAGGQSERFDLCIGAYIWNEHIVQWLLPRLRERGFRGRIVLGGPQISYAGAGLELLYPPADVFVRGYAESALVSLAKSTLPRPLPGVHYAGQIDQVEQAQVALDTLPSPLLTGVVPVRHGDALVRMETQRGCPFRCSFCQHREAGSRLTSREIPLDRVLAEVDLVCGHAVAEVAILDPVFNMGSTHSAVLEQFLRHGFAGRLSVQARLEAVDELFLDQCAALDLLPEFGLQSIHRGEQRAVRRPNAMKRVTSALEQLGRRQQDYLVSVIYGLPEQTLESFRQTVDFLLMARVPIVRAFPLVLLRGTELELQRARWELQENESAIPAVVASSTFDRADWQRMASISEALRRTEGDHPPIGELLILADSLHCDSRRFTPSGVVR